MASVVLAILEGRAGYKSPHSSMDRTLACGAGDRGSNPLEGTKINMVRGSRGKNSPLFFVC